ncbi:MAG TPA: bifunctional isocitrate dehydrogenase kinase/phosphatase [Pseudomonadales bacterium]
MTRGKSAMASAADGIARAIAMGYESYQAEFQAITAMAQSRFEGQDWAGVQDAGARRLAIYGEHVRDVVAEVHTLTGGSEIDASLWRKSKQAFTSIISEHYNAELYETFYNSIHREMTDDSVVDDTEMFVRTLFPIPPVQPAEPVFERHAIAGEPEEFVRTLLDGLAINRPWVDRDRDVRNILRSLSEERPEIQDPLRLDVDILKPIFYRNKGAYVVGRLLYKDEGGAQLWPFALALLLDDDGRLYVDTLICDVDELSVMFSFTRAYFMVLTDYPHALVDFLQVLLPNKKRTELYASMGLHKHGKTVFYRDFLDHLSRTDDQFVIAPGTPGMVMTVFTLPSLQTVFKVIKDEFAPQKNITAQQVRDKYYVVKSHDRVGRMADTQEFQNLTFPIDRFDPELVEELRRVAPSSIEISGNEILIRHLYTERLMTPLNLFIDTADEGALREALEEYGNAIKQLAAANIFPGDMLLKNFGVTRHGRVVFYDYDEICYLTDVNFRDIPEPRSPEDEMAAEPWYAVGPHDVFPEEFRRFLFGRRKIKQMFEEMHGELFEPSYWRGLQAAINDGQVMDVFPYRRKRRFGEHGAASRA